MDPRTTIAALHALDEMGLALTTHNHQWSPELRRAYEDAVDRLTKEEGGGAGEDDRGAPDSGQS